MKIIRLIMKNKKQKILDGVYDNTKTNRRERWTNGKLTSFLSKDKKMIDNEFFPWGCFEDIKNEPIRLKNLKMNQEG